MALAIAAAYVLLLVVYRLAPGMLPDSASAFLNLGAARCIADAPGLFNLSCTHAGYPYGAPSPFGLPLQALMGRAIGWLHLSPLAAYHLVYAAALAAAMLGCMTLFRRVGGGSWLALLGTLLFLANPIVALEGPYGALRVGFALLPAYLCVDLWVLDHLHRQRSLAGWLACLGALGAMRTFALFCDGYSFVMALMLGGCLWAGWLYARLRERAWLRGASGAALALLSIGIAVGLYKLYIPRSDYAVEPLDFFRGQGVDQFMLVVPSAVNWLASATGAHHSVAAYRVYSDGPSSSYVYLGYSFIACALAVAWLAFRRRLENPRLVLTCLGVGLLAWALSIGPALKWHDFRPPDPAATVSYTMPAGRATLELWTGWIYEHVPGIRNMRALYRWHLLVRLGLVVAAIAVLARLARRRRYVALGLLAVVLLAETLPSLPQALAGGRRAHRTVQAFEREVAAPFQAALAPGSRVLLLPLHPDAGTNPYLATDLCASARVYCYNVGGDKATALASSAWPAPVFDATYGRDPAGQVEAIFRCGLADAVVVPFFDLRWQAYGWPPPSTFPRQQVEDVLRGRLTDDTVEHHRWFAVIRPAHPSPLAPTCPDPSGYATATVAHIAGWGPQAIDASARGRTFIWVRAPDAPPGVAVAIDDHVLATTRKDDTLLVASVRKLADRGLLAATGDHAIYLVDPHDRTRQRLGTIRVER